MHDETGRDAALLDFSGPATIRQAGGAHARLLEALEAGAPVALDVAGVTVADVSFAQLVEAARRAFAEAGVTIGLTAPADGPLRDILDRGGFLDAQDAARRQFWTAGAAQ